MDEMGKGHLVHPFTRLPSVKLNCPRPSPTDGMWLRLWGPPGKMSLASPWEALINPYSEGLGPVGELPGRLAYQGGIYLFTVQIISHQISLLLSALTS